MEAPDISARAWEILSFYRGDWDELIEWAMDTTKFMFVDHGKDPERLTDGDLEFAKGCLLAGYKIDGTYRPSWYFAVKALRHLKSNPTLAEKCIRLAEEIGPIEAEEWLARHFRQSHAAKQKRKHDHSEIAADWERRRQGGASIGDANRETARKYGIGLRQVQNIRKRKKANLAG